MAFAVEPRSRPFEFEVPEAIERKRWATTRGVNIHFRLRDEVDERTDAGSNYQTIRKADTKTRSTGRLENVAQFSGDRSRGAAGRVARFGLAGAGANFAPAASSPGLNVNDIAEALNLPQSTVSSNLQILESAGLIRTETQKGRKGNQKLCFSAFDEVLVMFRDDVSGVNANAIEVAMPIGLYTSCEVSAPCGLCSPKGVIGLLDVPGTFLDPDRMNAGLMWFTRGFVEYQFPNNARHVGKAINALEFSFELSSEVPGTASDWPSDITVAVNGREVGAWTSPGDFGDQRGVYTPDWWKLKGSQYGMLKSWRVTPEGAFVDGVKISSLTSKDLDFSAHHSIRLRIEVKADARHPGGVNIFGRGFGNYDQDIVLQTDDRRVSCARRRRRARQSERRSRLAEQVRVALVEPEPDGLTGFASRLPSPSTISWPAGVST